MAPCSDRLQPNQRNSRGITGRSRTAMTSNNGKLFQPQVPSFMMDEPRIK